MIVVMKSEATKEEIEKVKSNIEELGYKAHPIEGVLRTVIGVVGDDRGKPHHAENLKQLQGVERVVPIVQPYKLASREVKEETSCFNISGVEVGNKKIPIIAGPCSVESEEQLMEIAFAVKDAGALNFQHDVVFLYHRQLPRLRF